jgi:REP element-mobilizing transposase RayT
MIAAGERSEPAERIEKPFRACRAGDGTKRMSHTNLLYHVVFATKERAPLITNDLRPHLHEYLGGIVLGLDGVPIEINGTADHVHVLARLRPTISVSEFMSKLKSSSSGWARRQTRGRFGWQARFAAFTVSESQLERVRRYIRAQEEHHRRHSFTDEFKSMLKANRLEPDDRNLWS